MHNSAKIFNEAKIVIQYLIMMWDREREREREREKERERVRERYVCGIGLYNGHIIYIWMNYRKYL